MENNKSKFMPTGMYYDGTKVYEIQIARSGDAARYRMTIAVEKQVEKTAVRFAFWHRVFSIEVIKSIKTVKA